MSTLSTKLFNLTSVLFLHNESTVLSPTLSSYCCNLSENASSHTGCCAWMLSHSVVAYTLLLHGLYTRFHAPQDSPGKNTGVGCQALLQGKFPTQGSNPRLLSLMHWQEVSSPLGHCGSNISKYNIYKLCESLIIMCFFLILYS